LVTPRKKVARKKGPQYKYVKYNRFLLVPLKITVRSSGKDIFTGNLTSNSYFHGNLGKPILLHLFLLGAFFQQIILEK
jgi:hypothetical protein